MVRAAPGGSIVGSVRGSARIGPPHKQAHQNHAQRAEKQPQMPGARANGCGGCAPQLYFASGTVFAVRGTPKGGV